MEFSFSEYVRLKLWQRWKVIDLPHTHELGRAETDAVVMQRVTWLMQNCKSGFTIVSNTRFAFEDRKEAMMFRLSCT